MVGTSFCSDGSKAWGASGSGALATHWCAAGALGEFPLVLEGFSKKLLLQRVGVVVQVTSRPLVMVSAPFRNRTCCASRSLGFEPRGFGFDRHVGGRRAPWVLPKVCPPAMSDGLLVVHGHAREGDADVVRRRWVGLAVGALRG